VDVDTWRSALRVGAVVTERVLRSLLRLGVATERLLWSMLRLGVATERLLRSLLEGRLTDVVE
jgi:hypothetical protein